MIKLNILHSVNPSPQLTNGSARSADRIYFLFSDCDCARSHFESTPWAFQISHRWLFVTWNEGEFYKPSEVHGHT